MLLRKARVKQIYVKYLCCYSEKRRHFGVCRFLMFVPCIGQENRVCLVGSSSRKQENNVCWNTVCAVCCAAEDENSSNREAAGREAEITFHEVAGFWSYATQRDSVSRATEINAELTINRLDVRVNYRYLHTNHLTTSPQNKQTYAGELNKCQRLPSSPVQQKTRY